MANLLKNRNMTIIVILIFSCLFCILFVACNEKPDNADEDKQAIDVVVTDDKSDEDDIETETQTEENAEPAKSKEEIEAEQTDTRITDIEYWERLGYPKDDVIYMYINAFLKGDTSTLEELAWILAGAYDEYKTIKLDKNYSVTKEIDETGSERIDFNFTVIESGVEYFPIGEYSMRVSDGPLGVGMYNKNQQYNEIIKGSATDAVNNWLTFGFAYLLPDYENLSDEEKTWFNTSTAEYIFYSFAEEVGNEQNLDRYISEGGYDWNNKWTIEMLQEYVEKYFGIENFPADAYPMNGGIYDMSMMAHGLHSWCMKYLEETTENDITTVTVQFFVDASCTIKSHTVEYKLQYLDGGYKFLSSTVVYEAVYEPKNVRM